MFRYLILGLLRNGEPQHGYALMKAHHDRSAVHISSGNFYRELSRLVGEGLVRAASNPHRADPRRVPYEITDLGAAAFDEWLAAPNAPPSTHYEDELSARVLFVAEAGDRIVRELLPRWQSELWNRVKALEQNREALLGGAHAAAEAFGPLDLLLARRMKHLAADLEFLSEFREAYEAWSSAARSPERPPSRPAISARVARQRH